MLNRDTFSSYHPTVNFLYFALVLVFSMCFMNPIAQVISLAAGLCYNINLCGRKAVRFSLVYMLPMALMIIIINPLFSHKGMTLLTYLPGGNPLTLESILYGCGAAAMLVSVIVWFNCFNEIITSDKFVYLFGKVIPSLSLVLSMTLRFVPKFTEQTKVVANAQRCMGRDVSSGSVLHRAKVAVSIMSIMLSWSLEDAIETADSMRSRGYGIPGRTAFSIYRFDDRDKSALAWLIFCGAYIIAGWIYGSFHFLYYPFVQCAEINPFNLSFMLVYALLCATPVVLNIKEERAWKRLRSEI